MSNILEEKGLKQGKRSLTKQVDRENSILDSDSDAPDFRESNSNPHIPKEEHHVIRFKKSPNPMSEGNRRFGKNARYAVKKRCDALTETTKQETPIAGKSINRLKSMSKLKSSSSRRGRSLERSNRIKKLITRSLSLRKPPSTASCFGCNDAENVSVCSAASIGSRASIFSQLGTFRKKKNKDNRRAGSTPTWKNLKWRWRRNRRNRTPIKEQTVFVKQASPLDVVDFPEYRGRGKVGKELSWGVLCASMEPVILCQEYFCAYDDDEELIGKVIGTEDNIRRSILRNGSGRHQVRFEETDKR